MPVDGVLDVHFDAIITINNPQGRWSKIHEGKPDWPGGQGGRPTP